MEMKRYMKILFHLGVFIIFIYTLFYDLIVLTKLISAYRSFAGPWKYLTFWNICFQSAFYLISFINDVAEDVENRNIGFLQKFCDHYFASVVWPVGNFVVIMFWVLYHIDTSLVVEPEALKLVPAWNRWVVHFWVTPFLFIEQLLHYHPYPRRKHGVVVTILVALTYLTWVFFIAFYADIWVYGVLKMLSWPGRVVFISALLVFIAILYVSGEYVTSFIWRRGNNLKLK